MKLKKTLIGLFILFVLSHFYNNYFTEGMLLGSYESNNSQSILEGPNGNGEKIILLENKKFKSDTWGDGTYELKYTISGTRINFKYEYEFGRASYNTYINRKFYGKPKIILDYDLEFYFEKVE